MSSILFKDVLGLYFAPTRPPDDEWSDHPLISRGDVATGGRTGSGRDGRASVIRAPVIRAPTAATAVRAAVATAPPDLGSRTVKGQEYL
ncbi:hypothetical protein AB0M34_08965 [Nocardia sp. NPDC050193]